MCEPIDFKKNAIEVSLNNIKTDKKLSETEIPASIKNEDKINTSKLLTVLKEVESAIRSKNYQSVENHFTEDGYKVFLRLIKYGNAVIVRSVNYDFIKFENSILARELPMKFTFTNRRTILENVVFTFEETNCKITSLAFSVSADLAKQIINQEVWNDYSKIAIINFIENYQTAYALERLDYLKDIFSDNALIIVGRIVTPAHTIENKYIPPKIERVKLSKDQYMKNLEGVFKNQEYVNLKFSDISIMKQPKQDAKEIYGIAMQQDYFSASYGDRGYLFLIVDLNNPNEPVIHVRTWQEEKYFDDDIGVYGFKDF